MNTAFPPLLAASRRLISALAVGIFSLTICLSAALMFAIQPMTGKMLLPIVGGTPAGWIVAMAFFQVMLLGGYLLAHLFSRFPPRTHAALYLLALAAGLYFMPADIRQHAGSLPPSPGAGDIFRLLCLSLSVPFIAISATSSTIQRLFTTTGHASAHDPYFLYAASNIGSFAGLLLYPFVFEPALSLSAQAGYSTLAYAALISGGMICLALSLLCRGNISATEPAAPAAATGTPAQKLSPAACIEWTALAFVPSSLLLGVTIYITTDIMSAPMIWVLPLCLYLLTFVIAFSRKSRSPGNAFQDMMPATALVSVITICIIRMKWLTDWTGMGFYLLVFTIAALACHIRLASLRPVENQSRHLTAFYLMMSVGGALGGVFNAFIVPLVADRLIEFPLMLVCALLLHPSFKPARLAGILTLGALALTAATMPVTPPQFPLTAGQLFDILFFTAGAGLILFGFFGAARRRLLRAETLIAASAVLLLAAQFIQLRQDVIYSQRNFYGTVRVFDRKTAENGELQTTRYLYHGTTVHGVQNITTPELQRTPTTYYTVPGPLGDIFRALEPEKVAAIGLGAGVVNCHAAPGRHFTFFEIDPAIVSVAEQKFSFLSACAQDAPPRIITGDGRLELSRLKDEHFDLVIVDAFSSDAIPVHLITLEAVEDYMARTSPDGIVAFHLSNRYFILEDRLAAIAETLGLQHAYRLDFRFHNAADDQIRFSSKWFVISRADLSPLRQLNREWVRLPPSRKALWTDDYSDIFSAIYVSPPARKPPKKTE